jgi:hypothetical protein
MPVHWGKNQPGMQAKLELNDTEKEAAKLSWLAAASAAASRAEVMSQLGVHKQIVNRLIEPFLWVEGVVTATEWENFFELRLHKDAQPEIQILATKMKEAIDKSTPMLIDFNECHLPYISSDEKSKYTSDILCKMSSARCCRVSYLKHDGTLPSVEDDISLCEKLTKSVPIHASPFEHIAQPLSNIAETSGNFVGWKQFRKTIEEQILNH